MINDSHVFAMGLCTPEELDERMEELFRAYEK